MMNRQPPIVDANVDAIKVLLNKEGVVIGQAKHMQMWMDGVLDLEILPKKVGAIDEVLFLQMCILFWQSETLGLLNPLNHLFEINPTENQTRSRKCE